MSNRYELMQIAATLVRGDFLPSDNMEDWQEALPKSTPKSAILEITQQSADAAEACRKLAIRLRDVSDSLQVSKKKPPPPHPSQAPPHRFI